MRVFGPLIALLFLGQALAAEPNINEQYAGVVKKVTEKLLGNGVPVRKVEISAKMPSGNTFMGRFHVYLEDSAKAVKIYVPLTIGGENVPEDTVTKDVLKKSLPLIAQLATGSLPFNLDPAADVRGMIVEVAVRNTDLTQKKQKILDRRLPQGSYYLSVAKEMEAEIRKTVNGAGSYGILINQEMAMVKDVHLNPTTPLTNEVAQGLIKDISYVILSHQAELTRLQEETAKVGRGGQDHSFKIFMHKLALYRLAQLAQMIKSQSEILAHGSLTGDEAQKAELAFIDSHLKILTSMENTLKKILVNSGEYSVKELRAYLNTCYLQGKKLTSKGVILSSLNHVVGMATELAELKEAHSKLGPQESAQAVYKKAVEFKIQAAFSLGAIVLELDALEKLEQKRDLTFHETERMRITTQQITQLHVQYAQAEAIEKALRTPRVK